MTDADVVQVRLHFQYDVETMTDMTGLRFTGGGFSLPATPLVAQTEPMSDFLSGLTDQLGSFLPSLIWAVVLLLAGWLIASVAATVVKNILNRTHLDDRLANWVLGQNSNTDVAVEKWAAAVVYWLIMTFAVVAFLNALSLSFVSEPLKNFLDQILLYLPRIGGAAILLGAAWVIATVVKLVVTRGLRRFNLDDRLAQTGATEAGRAPFMVNETVGDALYWFVFLLFVPLILSALNIPGLLQPVESLINQFLSAVPKILTALIVLGLGWLVARLVRGIVTNLLVATGADQLGARFGLATHASPGTTPSGVTLSGLVGTVVYVLILIPTAVAALNELDIEAISGPAILMLDRILTAIPQVLMAGVVLVLFYAVGRFVADLLSSVLTSTGFDNIFHILGLPELSPAVEAQTTLDAEGLPATTVRAPGRTPSEVVGLIVLVGIVLFGAVTATEILGFDQLTEIVRSILKISAQVLSGIVVFAVGLYFANLAFRLINSMGSSQSNTLAQSARIAIIALVGAMALQQMGVATNIVNLAFGLLLGAVAVAIALAFGLGGRDVAAEQLRDWISAFKRRS